MYNHSKLYVMFDKNSYDSDFGISDSEVKLYTSFFKAHTEENYEFIYNKLQHNVVIIAYIMVDYSSVTPWVGILHMCGNVIQNLCVHKNHRRQYVASRLIDEAFKVLEKNSDTREDSDFIVFNRFNSILFLTSWFHMKMETIEGNSILVISKKTEEERNNPNSMSVIDIRDYDMN